MAETIWTVPNAITLLRILLIIPFVFTIAQGRFVAALALFLVAGASDLIDGYAARSLGQESSVGRMLDPAADKLLTTAAFVGLAIPRPDLPSIPLWLSASVVLRDVVIVLGSLAVYLTTRFTGFKPSLMGKINTWLELLLILWFLGAHTTGILTAALPVGYIVVLASVILSGGDYIRVGIKIIKNSG